MFGAEIRILFASSACPLQEVGILKEKTKYTGINDMNDLLFSSWCAALVFIKLQLPTPIFQYRTSHPFEPERLDAALLFFFFFLQDKQTAFFFTRKMQD